MLNQLLTGQSMNYVNQTTQSGIPRVPNPFARNLPITNNMRQNDLMEVCI